jgi:tetratricopeptide (TPR) repeat protein
LSGWIALALLGLGAGAALVAMRLGRVVWTAGAAALVLGAAGYAWQGRPSLGARVASTAPIADAVDPEMSALRLAMFGRFTYAEPMFIASDGLIRAGAPRGATALLIGAVRAQRENAALWTALGQAYAIADGEIVSPAARFAFTRAMQLWPNHPGPPFFAGLAYVRAGEFATARALWARALRLTPPEARFRPLVAERLMLLDQLLAMEEAAPR